MQIIVGLIFDNLYGRKEIFISYDYWIIRVLRPLNFPYLAAIKELFSTQFYYTFACISSICICIIRPKCFYLFSAWFLLFTSHEVGPRKLQLGCGNSSPAQVGNNWLASRRDPLRKTTEITYLGDKSNAPTKTETENERKSERERERERGVVPGCIIKLSRIWL